MEGWYHHHHGRGGGNDWDLHAVVRYACGGRVSPLPPSSSSDDPFSSFLAPLEVKDEEGLPYAATLSLPFNGDAAVLDELSIAFFGAGAASARPGPSQPQLQQLPAATDEETLKLHRDEAAPPPLLPQTSGRQASGGEGSRSKRKKKQVKKVVQRVAADGVSADPWAWRKYGQKPIKGSPYPRGYYRCSTDKACAARKMVERCRDDPDAFILTYTGGDHSHPAPVHRNSLAGTTRNRQQQRAAEPPTGGAAAVAAEPSPGQSTSGGGSPTTTSPRSPSLELEEECNQEETECVDETGGASVMPKDEDVEMAGEEDLDELKTFLGAYNQPAMDDDVGDSSRHATMDMDGNDAAGVSPLLNDVEETFVVTPWATALGDATGWS